MTACRGCADAHLTRVLDLGTVPPADFFPPAADPVRPDECTHRLAMDLCGSCGLAQLADDDTVPDEPRGVEPQALRDQAAAAVRAVAAEGVLSGSTVVEFGSPHGGSWLPLLAARGFRPPPAGTPADVVLDCFGMMHEPDQRTAAHRRTAALAEGGTLLLQFHSLASILTHRQWTMLRHGHFAYYSLDAALRLLREAGVHPVGAWRFDLYGGTVLVAARRAHRAAVPPSVRRLLDAEAAAGVGDPSTLRALQHAADEQTAALRDWLVSMSRRRRTVAAYGAASRAVALFARARVDRAVMFAVADAAPAKQGRRMPGTDVPIVAPGDLVRARPDHVLLTLPDLLPEVRRRWPELDGRWRPLPDGRAPGPR